MISYESVQLALQHIVNNVGEDFTPKRMCKYVDSDDEPLCIVGVYLSKYCNIPAQFFHGLATGSSGLQKNEKGFRYLKNELGDSFGLKWDDNAVTFLEKAQKIQDEGKAWGEAVEGAKHFVDRDIATIL
jgi:hypothetical protein